MAFDFHVITGETIHRLLGERMQECVEVVREAYLTHERGESINPNSYFLRFPEKPSARIIALPAYLGGECGVAGIKWIASYPDNVAKGFPRASAVLILNDYQTGYPFACLESSIVSAARTAASAALAARVLNPSRQARTLAIIGTGLIARYAYEFLVGTGFAIDDVALHDLNRADAERFRANVLKPQHRERAVVADTARDAVRRSDLVLLATTAAAPHLIDPADFAHRPVVLNISLRDIGTKVILGAQNVVDDVGHVMNANTSVHLAEQETGSRAFVAGTLAQLVNGAFAVDAQRAKIFSPFGLGILDLAVGKWLFDLAAAQRMSTVIPNFFYELTR